MIKKLLFTLCFCFITSVSFGALVLGTNCGFVTSAPSADPDTGIFGSGDNMGYSFKVTAPVGATTITEMGWYVGNNTTEANYQLGLYSHNVGDNEPEDLLETTGDQAKGTTLGWKKVTGLSWSITAGTIYWITVQMDAATPNTYIAIGGSGRWAAHNGTISSLPNPWGTSSGFNTSLIAIYAVYTTGGGGARRVIMIQ